MAVGRRNTCDDTKYDPSSSDWKLEVRLDARNPASYASMLRRHPTQTNYPQREVKQQLPRSPIDSHSPANLNIAQPNIYRQTAGDLWRKDAENIRKMKEERCNASNLAVEYLTEHEVSLPNGGEREHISSKDLQHNGSLSGKPFEETEETNHRIGETKPIPRNAANQESRERLSQIYDKVLVVDNISVAKDIVGKLTNQYSHLVHACDTEACFLTFLCL